MSSLPNDVKKESVIPWAIKGCQPFTDDEHTRAGMKRQTLFDDKALRTLVATTAKSQKIPIVDEDALACISLAAEERLRQVLERMIQAAKHRVRTQVHGAVRQFPLQVMVEQDTKTVLRAIERVDRKQEMDRKQKKETLEKEKLHKQDMADQFLGQEVFSSSSLGPVTGGGHRGAKRGKKKSVRSLLAREPERVATHRRSQIALEQLADHGPSYNWLKSSSQRSLHNKSKETETMKSRDSLVPTSSSLLSSVFPRPFEAGGDTIISVGDALFSLEHSHGTGRSGGGERTLLRGYCRQR
ncbi:hypothetical protein BGZ83_009067 [Gryganskiella cystojenkinii]|nr:hypothetical protein BGZ83_009067 [Gryganskiella cystojenkinii]